MIDPRMIRPEAVAPTTEIVTPTPQYYGQGQVVGGQIQLGDVYGRLPSQSQEEYMYGNLANIANAAMGLAQIPGQLEQNQKRRDQQHDQDALNLYQIELNNIEQSSLNGESFYKYDNIEHPINNPEYKSKLELHIQEKMLGNLITPSGKAEASRLKTSILSQRNQSIDGRIQELLVEYKNEFNRFKSENILLNPAALDEAYRSDPALSKLREQIQSYRDTDSTVYESATTQINEEEFNFARDARSYLMEESAREVTESFSVLANTLPGFLESLQNPNLDSVKEFIDWIGEVDNPQELYGLVGALPDGTVVEGMLLNRVTNSPTVKDIKELMTVILDHQLQTVEMFSPEQRDTFVRAVVNSMDDQITKAASDHYNRVRERNVSAEQLARMNLHNSTVTEAGNDRYIVSSGAYTGTATEEFKGLIDNTLLNKNVGTDPKRYVTLAAQSYWVDNLGMPGAPISNHTIRNAASLLDIDKEDLFEQGYYKKDENGKTYLTDKGIKFQQDKTRELINELVKENGYKGLVKTAVGNIRANTSVMGASSLEAASIAINNQVIGLVRKYFPLDQSITNNDILKTFGLVTDPEQEPSQALLSVMGADYSRGIKSEVEAILDAWAESAKTTSVSSSGNTANSWITTKNPLNNPKLKAEALDYIERILTNPDRVQEAIDEEWERLITIGGHNPASVAQLHQAAMDLHRRTYTGNISLQSLSRVGLIDPNITVSVGDLANFDLNKVTNPRNLLVDPKYFDRNTFKFTQEGAVAWAAYTNQLFHGPLVNENSESVLENFIEAVSFLEEGARAEEQGIYFIALSSFIRSSQQASSTGIGARHSQSGLTSIREVTLSDGTIMPLEYDPTIDPQRDWNSIYGSVDEQSFTLASQIALRIATQIASVPDEEINSPQKIQEVIRSETRLFAGMVAVSRDDIADFSRANNLTLTSGLPKNNNERLYSPPVFTDQFRNYTTLPDIEETELWGLWTGLLNLYRDPNRRMQVTLENVDMIASQTTRGAIDYLQRTNSNRQFIVPTELANAWNADSLNNSDEILEGTRLKLWSSNPDEITIQTLLGYMERSNNLDGVHKIPLLREVMDMYRVGLNTSSPGDPNNLIQLVGMSSYLSDRNSIPYSADENIYESSIRLNDVALLMISEPIPGNNRIRFRNFSGNSEEDAMTSYIIPDSYPTSLSISGQATDRNGNIMFANPGNRLASEFLESTPNTSNNPEEYAKARLDWVIKTVPGFEQAWSKLSEERKAIITRLSSDEDTTLISFLKGSIWVASRERSDSGNVNDYPSFTFNRGGLESKEFTQRVSQGGWELPLDRRSSYGFELDNNGHYIIRNNTSGVSLTLDPKIMGYVDQLKVMDSIVGPPPISLQRYRLPPGKLRALQQSRNRIARERWEKSRRFDDPSGENTPLDRDLEKTIRELEVEFKIDKQDSGFWDGEKVIPIGSNTSASGSSLGLGGIASALSQTAMAGLPPQQEVAELIMGEEGFISTPRKATPKEDHLTVGHGHKLDGSKRSRNAFKKTFPNKNYDEFMAGKGSLTKEEALRLFEADLPDYIKRAESFTNYEYIKDNKTKERPRGKKLGGLTFKDHSPELQKYIISATYRGTWGASQKTRKLLSEGKYEAAAQEFLNSDEYRNAVERGRKGIRKRMDAVAKAIRDEAKRNKS